MSIETSTASQCSSSLTYEGNKFLLCADAVTNFVEEIRNSVSSTNALLTSPKPSSSRSRIFSPKGVADLVHSPDQPTLTKAINRRVEVEWLVWSVNSLIEYFLDTVLGDTLAIMQLDHKMTIAFEHLLYALEKFAGEHARQPATYLMSIEYWKMHIKDYEGKMMSQIGDDEDKEDDDFCVDDCSVTSDDDDCEMAVEDGEEKDDVLHIISSTSDSEGTVGEPCSSHFDELFPQDSNIESLSLSLFKSEREFERKVDNFICERFNVSVSVPENVLRYFRAFVSTFVIHTLQTWDVLK